MNRRTTLKLMAGVGSGATLSGCLGSVASFVTGQQWRYSVGGELDTVVDGTVLVRERSAGPGETLPFLGSAADGEIVALDADTGERQWGYGESGYQSSYSGFAVGDGIYFGQCHDTGCGGLHALDFDGEKRWTRDIHLGYQRPHVADGTVYTSGVHALDAETGKTRWTAEIGGRILDISDAVYLDTAVLDPDDGSVLWSYDGGARLVDDGVAYVTTAGDQVAAVAEGEELWRSGGGDLWHYDFEAGSSAGNTLVRDVESGHLFVHRRPRNGADRLYALDVTTGEGTWVAEATNYWDIAFHGGVVYVGTDQLRALDAETGRERWHTPIADERIWSVTVVEANEDTDHAVFVHYDENRFARLDPTGTQLWDGAVDGMVENYLVGDSVFVATEAGIYALEY